MQFFVERVSGLRAVAAGPDGWEGLGLDHADVTMPGRVRALGFMDDSGRQTVVRLAPNETLHLVVRKGISLNPGGAQPPPLMVLGIKREDGSGTYALVQPDGNITISSSLNG